MAFQVNYLNCSDELKRQVEQIIASWHSEQASFEVQTSGSTGTPKKITHKRAHFLASAQRTNNFFGLTQNAHVLLAISPQFIGGMMVVIRALVGDYQLSVIEPNQVISVDNTITFDFVSLVPKQIERFRTENPTALLQFRTILLGGTGINELLCDFLVGLHSNSYIGFGMTETISHIALRKINEPQYTCLPGVSVSQENSVLVINDTDLSIANLTTNDLIELQDNQHFTWLGRKDFVINSGGIKLFPEKMEEEIQSFITGDYIIAGIKDEELGQRCVLILNENALLLVDFNHIQNKLKDTFGKYAAPKTWLKIPFHFSENGKVLRKKTIDSLK